MPTSLAATVAVGVTANYANSLAFGGVAQSLQYNIAPQFTDGVLANQAQKLWSSQRTLTASAFEDLDLAGVLTDVFGQVLTLTKIKALIIKAADANVNDVVVGGAATNGLISFFGAATDKVKIKPGGTMVLIAPDINGYAVVAATGDLLRVTNGGAGTSVLYDITVIGL